MNVRIAAASLDEQSRQRLLRWLARRPEVRAIDRRRQTCSLVVRCEEEHGDLFVGALRDELFRLRSRPKPAIRTWLAHVLPGRARLRTRYASERDVARLAAFIAKCDGVTRVTPSAATGSILFLYDSEQTNARAVLDAVRASKASEWPEAEPERRHGAAKAAFDTGVLGVVWTGLTPPPVTIALVGATALPVVRRALAAARERRISVDVLDVAAITISLATGQPRTAALVTWLLGIGDLVLERTSDRARSALAKLTHFDAESAWLVRRDRVVRVPVKKLRRGDRIRVHVGEQVPADGVVVAGNASVDEKALTGESMPRTKRVGARVLAASVLHGGEIDVDVTRVGSETTAARIVRILEGAGAKPMTLQRETERIADRVVLPTIGLALAAGSISGDLGRLTSVLITDFGTGIRIAAPTSALAAMTVAARQGVLVKGGQYLERLSKVDVLVCDKTGTLTQGEPRIVDVERKGSLDVRDALALAAAAESRHAHPIASAIRRHARDALGALPDLAVRAVAYEVAAGVRASVDGHEVLVGGRRLLESHHVDTRGIDGTTVFVAVDGRVELTMTYADIVRDETRAVVAALRAGGRREIVLMSGDAKVPVDAVARDLGIARRFARMMPEDKAREIRAMRREGHVVAMIGDGINDAPALAVADVGISIGGATEVALETADVVLVDGGLVKLPLAFQLADAGMASVRRGLALVVAPNAVAIVLGALGVIAPGVATVINNGSTIAAALAGLAPLAMRQA